VKYAFIEAQRGSHSLRLLCRAFGLYRANHYAYKKRAAKRQAPLRKTMRRIHEGRFTKHYGSPRMTTELRARGYVVNKKRVARLLRKEGINASRRGRFMRTTESRHDSPTAPKVLQRDFSIGTLNHYWVGDMTYLRTLSGFVYLAAILDVGTRKWVGYAVARHMRTLLCLDALKMALDEEDVAPKFKHTDRGRKSTGADYRNELRQQGIALSMSG